MELRELEIDRFVQGMEWILCIERCTRRTQRMAYRIVHMLAVSSNACQARLQVASSRNGGQWNNSLRVIGSSCEGLAG